MALAMRPPSAAFACGVQRAPVTAMVRLERTRLVVVIRGVADVSSLFFGVADLVEAEPGT
jgi:hypothetical protein